jgi:hypothetical protein
MLSLMRRKRSSERSRNDDMGKALRQAHGPYTSDEFGPYYLLPLTKGLEAKISPDDVGRVAPWNWSASRESRDTKWYAIRFERRGSVRVKIRLHRFVMDQPPGSVCDDFIVDHCSDDGLDCRRTRLEVITQAENMLRVPTWKKKGMAVEPTL